MILNELKGIFKKKILKLNLKSKASNYKWKA